jgi:hypothetical protein
MKDKSAAGWRERKQYYKVGSPMKGCRQCGEIEEDERGKERWITGMQVFRSYRPWEIGWTFKCWDCSATDLRCWGNDELGLVAAEIGKEPILGNRDVVKAKKYALRKEAMRVQKQSVDLDKLEKIKELQLQIEQLKLVLQSQK